MGILDRALMTAEGGARLTLHGIQRLRAARHGRSSTAKDIGDADLANKVRTEIFRNLRGVDKGQIDVNVVDGAVYLRGVVKTPRQINALEERASAIPEVRAVHNLLHLPHTPAPTRTDTPPQQRKTRRAGTVPEKPRREPRRVNADKTADKGEPVTARAEERSGRGPAPFGS
jgi:BON domain